MDILDMIGCQSLDIAHVSTIPTIVRVDNETGSCSICTKPLLMTRCTCEATTHSMCCTQDTGTCCVNCSPVCREAQSCPFCGDVHVCECGDAKRIVSCCYLSNKQGRAGLSCSCCETDNQLKTSIENITYGGDHHRVDDSASLEPATLGFRRTLPPMLCVGPSSVTDVSRCTAYQTTFGGMRKLLKNDTGMHELYDRTLTFVQEATESGSTSMEALRRRLEETRALAYGKGNGLPVCTTSVSQISLGRQRAVLTFAQPCYNTAFRDALAREDAITAMNSNLPSFLQMRASRCVELTSNWSDNRYALGFSIGDSVGENQARHFQPIRGDILSSSFSMPGFFTPVMSTETPSNDSETLVRKHLIKRVLHAIRSESANVLKPIRTTIEKAEEELLCCTSEADVDEWFAKLKADMRSKEKQDGASPPAGTNDTSEEKQDGASPPDGTNDTNIDFALRTEWVDTGKYARSGWQDHGGPPAVNTVLAPNGDLASGSSGIFFDRESCSCVRSAITNRDEADLHKLWAEAFVKPGDSNSLLFFDKKNNKIVLDLNLLNTNGKKQERRPVNALAKHIQMHMSTIQDYFVDNDRPVRGTELSDLEQELSSCQCGRAGNETARGQCLCLWTAFSASNAPKTGAFKDGLLCVTVDTLVKHVFLLRQKTRFAGACSLKNEEREPPPVDTTERIDYFYGKGASRSFASRRLPNAEEYTTKTIPPAKTVVPKVDSTGADSSNSESASMEGFSNSLLKMRPSVKHFLFNTWFNNARVHQTHASAKTLYMRLYPVTPALFPQHTVNVNEGHGIQLQVGLIFRQLQAVSNCEAIANIKELHTLSYVKHSGPAKTPSTRSAKV
jgi:hypothetical protein